MRIRTLCRTDARAEKPRAITPSAIHRALTTGDVVFANVDQYSELVVVLSRSTTIL